MTNKKLTKTSLKPWISPSLTIVYLVISVTGVLMLFHIKSRMIVNLHEWLGLLFVGVGVIHLLINWKLLLSVIKKRPAIISICLVAVISLLIVFTGEDKPRDSRMHQSQAIHVEESITNN